MEIKPIAYIETDFSDKFGIPRQSGRVPSLVGKIVFYPEYRNPESLHGIEGFTHLWLLFDFSKSHRKSWSPTVRPPRLGGNKRVGVFASRSPFRPNPIGLSSVKLERIEHDDILGDTIIVSGIDLLDKTPIYDIKPYLPSSDCHTDAIGGYADNFTDYHLDVVFPSFLLDILPEEKREAVVSCLSEDPRPSYQDDPDREYSMKYAGFDIHFKVNDKTLTVTGVDIV